MEQVFNFFVEFGQVFVGVVSFFVFAGLVVILIIEILDFLIVDPIKRAANKPTAVEEDV